MDRLPRVTLFVSALRLSLAISVLLAGQVRLAQAHGDYHDVAAEVQKGLEQDPRNADLHFRLAVAAEEHGDWAQALISLEMTERLAPGRPLVPLVQGKALAKAGQWQAAKTALDAFIEADPDHTIARVERARVLIKLARPSLALEDFQQAFNLAQKPSPEWYGEAARLMQTQGQQAQALALLKQGLERAGPDPELLKQTLDQCAGQDDVEGALACLEALQNQSVEPLPWMAEKARLLVRSSRPEAAQQAWRDLHSSLLAMPSLQRGLPASQALLAEAEAALGLSAKTTAAVVAPPAAAPPHSRRSSLPPSYAPTARTEP